MQFETGFGDWCYSPIIQSGGNYELKSSAQSDDQRLKAGVILCSLGIRYKSYCSNVGRTFMIDPTPVRTLRPVLLYASFRLTDEGPELQEQEKNYLFVAELQKFALSELKEGVVCKDFYQKIVERIQADRPDLADRFMKTAGFGVRLSSSPSFLRVESEKLTKVGTRRWELSSVTTRTRCR